MVAFATQVKRRRGTTAQNDAFTGAEGEIVVDTQKHTLRVHDGVTQGGFEMATQEDLDSKADVESVESKANKDLSNTQFYLLKNNDGTLSWNDINMSAMSLPSEIYINLTLGASDSTYTAPEDGWVVFGKVNGTSAERFIQLENRTQLLKSRSTAPYQTNGVFVFIPVCRGDIFSTAYDCAGNTLGFRFIYAKGSKHLAS